jgi:hypothetical protein
MLDYKLLYKKFIELEDYKDIPVEWQDEYRAFFKEQYKIYGNGVRGFAKKTFFRKKIQEVYSKEWNEFKSYISTRYTDEGVGIKLLAKELDISYTKVRRLLEHFMDIEIRKGTNVVTDHLRKVRSENAKLAGGWRHRKTKNKNTQRGVQGYFYNNSRKKYVWLRSTYEFIFAKWLDKNKIDWDVETQQWNLGEESYRPDFFIYENSTLVKIVEVKGYYKNRLWKFEELKKLPELKNIEFCLIDDITPFLDNTTYLGELKCWKTNRLLELE